MSLQIAPSILAADHAALGQEIKDITTAGADMLHIDVMDGHFVPNLTMGPCIVKALRPHTRLPFDVHLMIERPDDAIDAWVDAGADWLTVHAEACTHLHRTLSRIREANVKVGVSLNPATPVQCLAHVLHMVDMVLVMSVNPGFGGQRFIEATLPKVQSLAQMQSMDGHDFKISIDGGITPDTIGPAAGAGAQIFVAGSAIFQQKDYAAAISALRTAASGGGTNPRSRQLL